MKTMKHLALVALLALVACGEGPTEPETPLTVNAPLGYYMTLIAESPPSQQLVALYHEGSTDYDAMHRALEDMNAIWPDVEMDEPWCNYVPPDETVEGVADTEEPGSIEDDPCYTEELFSAVSAWATGINLVACLWPGPHCWGTIVGYFAWYHGVQALQECLCMEGEFSDLPGETEIVAEDWSIDAIAQDTPTTVGDFCGQVEGWSDPGAGV